MRFKMIGYGPFDYRARSGEPVRWPVIGVALQKNYISVYFAVSKDGEPVTAAYLGRLNETRAGRGNISFVRFNQLDRVALAQLVAETQTLFECDPSSMAQFERVS